MKFKFLIAILGTILLFSCTSENENSVETDTNYLPLAISNYWKYNIDTDGMTQTDSLYISNDTLITGKTYKKFKTRNLPAGFYSNSLNKNSIRRNGASLLLTGTLALDFGVGIPINLNLNDFVIFNENASDNQQLSIISGTINQTVDVYPLVIDYILTSTEVETLPTYTSNNHVYTDVKRVKTVLNAKITTNVFVGGFPYAASILSPQNVVVSNQYYAKNIGMVYTNTIINYQLNQLPGGTTLPIPSTGNQTQNEYLNDYNVSH